jgi:hypothetical protein
MAYIATISHERHSIMSHVVQTSNEGANVSGASNGSENRLISREAKRHVDGDLVAAQLRERLETGGCCRQLDDYLIGPLGVLTRLEKHAFWFLCSHLDGNGPWYERCNLRDGRLEIAMLRLGNQGGVRSNAIDHSPGGGFANFVYVGSVQKKAHSV